MKSVPNGISSSGENWTGLQILITPPAAASYRKRLRWRTRPGGSASMSICWLASLRPDEPPCMDCDWETRMRASCTVSTESGCEEFGVSHHWQDIHADGTRRKEEIRTRTSRWSDRQTSVVTTSGLFDVRTNKRDFPPNIRVIGDSTNLAY